MFLRSNTVNTMQYFHSLGILCRESKHVFSALQNVPILWHLATCTNFYPVFSSAGSVVCVYVFPLVEGVLGLPSKVFHCGPKLVVLGVFYYCCGTCHSGRADISEFATVENI